MALTAPHCSARSALTGLQPNRISRAAWSPPNAADAADHGPDLLNLGIGRHPRNVGSQIKGVGPAYAVAVDAMDDRLWAMDHLGEGFFQCAFVGAHPDHVVAIARPVVADIAPGRKEATAGG